MKWLLSVSILILGALTGCVEEPEGAVGHGVKLYFDLPEGPAREMLVEAASKAKAEIMFSMKDVDGVTTNPVEGYYTLEDAFDIMLKNTALKLVETSSSGVYFVRRMKSSASMEIEDWETRASSCLALPQDKSEFI